MDHLYNVKGMIQQSGKSHMQLGDIKRAGVSSALIKKLPRDARGRISPEMIDKHIEGLPKHKVQIDIVPFDMNAQKHREDIPQYVATVGFHPETIKKMRPRHREMWENIKDDQHNFSSETYNSFIPHSDQIGWARIDPYFVTHKENKETDTLDTSYSPNKGHWHVDEIQSDFNSANKIDGAIKAQKYDELWGKIYDEIEVDKKHPLHESFNEIKAATKEIERIKQEWDDKYVHPEVGEPLPPGYETDPVYKEICSRQQKMTEKFHEAMDNAVLKEYDTLPKQDSAGFHQLLSHGHEDPQHLMHSAINALARKHGISSISMDTPKDQAEQSGLNVREGPSEDDIRHEAQTQWKRDWTKYQKENFTPDAPLEYILSEYEKLKKSESSVEITRFEVINHAKNTYEVGRLLTLYQELGDFNSIELSFQDGGRTLKVFLD
jgi:hypothetical protein